MIKKFVLCDQSPWLWSNQNMNKCFYMVDIVVIHMNKKKDLFFFWEEGQKVFDSKNFLSSSLDDSFPNVNRVLEL